MIFVGNVSLSWGTFLRCLSGRLSSGSGSWHLPYLQTQYFNFVCPPTTVDESSHEHPSKEEGRQSEVVNKDGLYIRQPISFVSSTTSVLLTRIMGHQPNPLNQTGRLNCCFPFSWNASPLASPLAADPPAYPVTRERYCTLRAKPERKQTHMFSCKIPPLLFLHA